MAKRITKLTLKNFKGFRYKEFPIEGLHTLLFGNNGAGKSSVHWALHALMHSTTKTEQEVAKYFATIDEYTVSTHESIRNIYAPKEEEAFVEIDYREKGKTISTDRIAAIGSTTFDKSNSDLHASFLASDFIHYRFLQDVYAYTNKNSINLWPVFERDVFPYFTVDNTSTETIAEAWDKIKSGPPKGPNGQRIAQVGTEPRRLFEKRLRDFNSRLAIFVNDITIQANLILKEYFFGQEIKFDISINYTTPIDFEEIRAEKIVNNRLLLRVRIPDPTNPSATLPVYRPQAFLNEAQLTRIALSIRLGALKTRPLKTNFQILCLDDLLISLDMVNRRHVLEWLFDSKSAITTDYQVFFFTHDWELFKMVRHYATTRQANDWNIFELSINEDLPSNKRIPHLLISNGNYYQQAIKHYDNGDYAACANYLRKELERVLKAFLSPTQLWVAPREDGDPGFKDLGTLIGEMYQTFTTYKIGPGKLQDLKWHKDSALNPLSHDGYGTTTYQTELHELVFDIFPVLQQLNSRTLAKTKKPQGTNIKFSETDALGVEHVYTVLIFEDLREVQFPNHIHKASSPLCKLLKHEARGYEVDLSDSEKSFKKDAPLNLSQVQNLVRKYLHGPLQEANLLESLVLS